VICFWFIESEFNRHERFGAALKKYVTLVSELDPEDNVLLSNMIPNSAIRNELPVEVPTRDRHPAMFRWED
jgi:hypothetical protein